MARWPAMRKRLSAKNSRGLPSWLFDNPSPEQQAQLDQIRVFGVDVVREREKLEQAHAAGEKAPSGDSGERSQASHKSHESQQQSLTPPLDDSAGPIEVEIPPVPSHPPPTPPMSSSPAPPPVPAPPAELRHKTPYFPDPSSDDEIAVRPLRQRRLPDSSFGSETPVPEHGDEQGPATSDQVTGAEEREEEAHGETSESELSEYERSRRRAMKARAEPQDSQSLSQSQDSHEFDLARYEFPLSMPVQTPQRPSASGTRSMPPISSSPAEEKKRKYELDSVDPTPAQRPRTEEPSSARSWRGPPSTSSVGERGEEWYNDTHRAEWAVPLPPQMTQVTPIKSEFVSEATQRLPTPTHSTAKPEPPDPEAAEPESKPLVAETEPERLQLDHNSHGSLASGPPRRASESRSRSRLIDSESGEAENKPAIDSESKPDLESESKPQLYSDSGPREELLGGWKPDLIVRGLNAEWVRKVTRAANDVRDRRKVKRER